MTINLPLSTALCIVGAFLAMNFRYIAEINQEVRQYSQKLRENIFFIKKIEDSFSELERIGIPNVCTKKVIIKLEENKKYLVQCKKNKLTKGFQINKKLHGSYASYIFSYGQDKNVESLFIAHCFTLFLTEIISLIHLKFRNILTNNKEILYDKEIKFIS